MADASFQTPLRAGKAIAPLLVPLALLLAARQSTDAERLSGGDPAPPAASPVRSAPAATSDVTAWCQNRLKTFLSRDHASSSLLRSRPRPSTVDTLAAEVSRAGADTSVAKAHVSGTYVSDVGDPPGQVTAVAPDLAVVALVPDPIDSGQRLLFDQQVSAIEAAMGYAGWERNRQWLPWEDRLLLDPNDRPYAATCRRDVPGVLVFRKKKEIAHVYLVGESLTSGPPTGATQYALGLASRAAQDGLRIVGPAFSNGAAGLKQEITSWRGAATKPQNVRVIAGSANGPELANEILSRPPKSESTACDDAGIEFRTTNIRIDRLECAFYRYIAPQVPHDKGGGPLKGVALMSELGTAYGQQTGQPNVTGTPPPPPRPGECEFWPGITLQFPIHVASIRDAYAASESRSSAASELARRTYLDVPLTEEPGLDVPVEMSSMTTASRDLALTHLLSEVSLGGIRYLGIVATSVSDELFLARKVRDVAPDVRLVFFENDALLTHPAVRQYTMGSFVVTAYPFVGSDDFAATSYTDSAETREGPPNAPHLPLESDTSEAVLNATLAAIDERPIEFTWRSRRGWAGPFVWIGTVGLNDVTPVHVALGDPRETCALAPPPASSANPSGRDEPPGNRAGSDIELRLSKQVTPPNIWQIVFAVLSILAIADWGAQRGRSRAMRSGASPPSSSPALPRGPEPSDRQVELDVVRMRYALAGALRFGVFWIALTWMLGLDVIALQSYLTAAAFSDQLRRLVACIAFVAVLFVTAGALRSTWEFGKRWMALCRSHGRPWFSPGALRRAWRRGKLRLAFYRGRKPPRVGTRKAAPVRVDPVAWAEAVFRVLRVLPRESRRARVHSACAVEAYRVIAVLALAAVSYVSYRCVTQRDLFSDFWRGFRHSPDANTALFVLRVMPLVGGLSPGWALLGPLCCVYFWCRMRMDMLWLRHTMVLRATDVGRAGTALPIASILRKECFTHGDVVDDSLDRIEVHAADAAAGPSTVRHLFWVAAAVILPVLPFSLKPVSTLEGQYGTQLLEVELGIGAFLAITSLLHLRSYWGALRLLLDRLERHPAIDWLKAADDCVRGHGFSLASFITVPKLRSKGRAAAVLVRRYAEIDSPTPAQLEAQDGMKTELSRAQLERSRERWASATTEGELVMRKASGAAAAMVEDLRDRGASNFDSSRASFVGTVLVLFIRQYTGQLNVMMFGVMAQSVALILTVSGYAIQPKRLLLTCAWVSMLSIASVGVWILIDTNRNTALSRISHTTPGRVDWNWDFAEHLFRWAAIPVLVMLAAEYPSATGSLWGKLAPVFHALR